MVDAFDNFDKRLNKIDRKHRALARGYTSRVGSDGLIVIRPRRRGLRLPVKGLALLGLGFFGLKGLMLAQIGHDNFAARLNDLNNGTIAEQAGAWIMQVDPATKWIAELILPLLH